MYQYWTWTD